MSTPAAPLEYTASIAPAARPVPSFMHHARLISLLTLFSRILGVVRESFAARYFGASPVASAFTVAFTIPNLFRRLFGEGALSAAFIPLYSRALRTQDAAEANRFAAASVNMLIVILAGITLAGEAVLWIIPRLWTLQSDRLLAVQLTAIMLPYVLLVCGTAFLGAILQVHRRFGLVAAAPIVLNLALIASTVVGARLWDLSSIAQQEEAMRFVAVAVLLAGVAQVAMLVPALRAIGFRFQWTSFWTPGVKRMLRLSLPVAIGAGVLQLSVLIDRGMSFFLAQSLDGQGQLVTHFTLLGETFRYPMQLGAAARLSWAQYLYQFPLGIFAIALATAIFPALSADALETDRERFREGMRRGIQATLWEGLPASVGLILVAQPTVQLLFERGRFTPHDTELVAMSVRFFSAAIWAFSLQQILNRAYYALHDTLTPLIMSVAALVIETAVKLPLVWRLGESGMAVGTSISFTMQSLIMAWMLERRIGNLGLRRLAGFAGKVILATAAMATVCLLIQKAPFYPAVSDGSKRAALMRLGILMTSGVAVYVGFCSLLGIGGLKHLLARK